MAATQDNTRVQFDLDGDGDYDFVDLDGGGVNPGTLPDAPGPGRANSVYVVDALSRSTFDPTDFDNTGTRIVANKPVAVAWGQETDLTGYGDSALDTGYTVYPTNQLFLDPVLVIDKDVDVTTVRTTGGVVTYTLTVDSFDFGPLTNLQIFDLLPAGVQARTTSRAARWSPTRTSSRTPRTPSAIDPATGLDRWTASRPPDTLATNQTITDPLLHRDPGWSPGGGFSPTRVTPRRRSAAARSSPSTPPMWCRPTSS